MNTAVAQAPLGNAGSRSSASTGAVARRYPIGAELVHGGCHFRVWAPEADSVAVDLLDGDRVQSTHPLTKEADGYFAGHLATARAASLYRYKLPGGSYP